MKIFLGCVIFFIGIIACKKEEQNLNNISVNKKVSEISIEGFSLHTFSYSSQNQLQKDLQPCGNSLYRFIYDYSANNFSRKWYINDVIEAEFKNGLLDDKGRLLSATYSYYYQGVPQSSFYDNHYTFNYDSEGYLIKMSRHTDSGGGITYTDTLEYQSGNMVKITTRKNGEIVLVQHLDYYTEFENQFNISVLETFSYLPLFHNGLLGRMNKNLLKSRIGSEGWPFTYKFTYQFDLQGFIQGMVMSDNESGSFIDTHYAFKYN